MMNQMSSSTQCDKMALNRKKLPPQINRQNAAKKSISMFKDNFKAILEVDNTFPIHFWYQLLTQAEHTLNIMKPTNIAPTVSAYAYM